MDELRKASILLKHLAPTERELILARFDAEQRRQLERMIAEDSDISHTELVGIITEYQSWLQRLTSNPVGDVDFGEPSIRCDVETLRFRLREEPATVVTAVMCQLPESAARDVFEALPEDRKAAVVNCLPAQAELRPLVKQELARFLSESATGAAREANPGQVLLARLVGP
jgi:flagellar motor switch protein FliG